ncbi:MAG: protein kinase [Candidatus Promineifilaceae bacterium]
MVKETNVGKTIGKYVIVEGLGRGGMAEVYLAYQESLDRYAAIKLMHTFLADEQDFLTRFQREARSMASLNHRNIVGVYDFDVQDGVYYIVMEYVPGGSLKQRLESLAEKGDKLPLSESTRVALEIADALSYAHGRGMVHRDIKPANIMINEEGHVVLTDFGIAKILSGPSFTATGAMIGTPAYMSPEQGLGQPGDERSDLYALGVLFYQMATGRLPYDADTPLAVIMKHVNEPIPLPSASVDGLPREIQAVIVKSLAKDPDERYQTGDDFANDLTAAASTSNLAVAAGLSMAFLKDRPTPPPPPPSAKVDTVAPIAATALAPQATVMGGAAETRLATPDIIEKTEIAAPVAPTPPKERSRWWIFLLVIVALIGIGGIAGGIFAFGSLGDEEPTPVPTAAVVAVVVEPTATSSVEPTATEEIPTVDIVGMAVDSLAATLTAQPTLTLLPTDTPAPTFTRTPDATGTFMASCEEDVELVESFTYNGPNSNAPTGSNFPMTWVIENSGTCILEEGLEWRYLGGESFGDPDPVLLETDLASGEQATLSTRFVAPSRAGTYASTWQLADEDGNQVGIGQTFDVSVFVPVTPTPRPTNTPASSPTPAQALGYNLGVFGCEYVGADWQCTMQITTYGGTGQYVVAIDDAEPPVQYEGSGPFFHPILSRRCNAWNHTITIRDSGSGQTISEAQWIDPNIYFEGGCIEQ